MINYNKNIKREGIYKEYFDKFKEDPITYGLYWNDIKAFEAELRKAIDTGVKYFEEPPEENIVY